MYVCKFGGTSIGYSTKIKHVISIIKKNKNR